MSGLTILYRMTGNSQNFARIKLGIKLISDSVNGSCFILVQKAPFSYQFAISVSFIHMPKWMAHPKNNDLCTFEPNVSWHM